MCGGSKAEMLCGHVETHFNSFCGKTKCSGVEGAIRYIDEPCPRCDPTTTNDKRVARTAELMSQFHHGENEDEVHNLTERAKTLDLSMRQGITEVRNMMYGPVPDLSMPPSPGGENQKYIKRSWGFRPSSRAGKAPWDPRSDSESEDDGRRDTSRLSADGAHVVQKEYKLINGHYALIAYRRELHEVDPGLLRRLREKRERELAKKKKRREEKMKKKERARNGDHDVKAGREEEEYPLLNSENFPSDEREAVERWRRISASRPSTPAARFRGKEKKASEPSSPRPSSRVGMIEAEEAKKTSRELKGGVPPLATEDRKTHKHKHKAPVSPHLQNSFKVRVDQAGIHPIAQRGIGSEECTVQAESSRDPAAHRGLRRIKGRTWVERFAEDITYDSAHSSSDADSVVTVIRVPVRQPGEKKSGKSTEHSKHRCQNRVIGGEEDLDIWQKLADEE